MEKALKKGQENRDKAQAEKAATERAVEKVEVKLDKDDKKLL
ncbi:MAG TPA: hypothetical protein VLF93_06530 [Candidatus Saccharimonadales bacterium]|nr:hypothetical protein [Candidatus Saccharimonadales bacterium]